MFIVFVLIELFQNLSGTMFISLQETVCTVRLWRSTWTCWMSVKTLLGELAAHMCPRLLLTVKEVLWRERETQRGAERVLWGRSKIGDVSTFLPVFKKLEVASFPIPTVCHQGLWQTRKKGGRRNQELQSPGKLIQRYEYARYSGTYYENTFKALPRYSWVRYLTHNCSHRALWWTGRLSPWPRKG